MPILDISNKNRRIFALLSLAYFIQHVFIHIVACARISFLFEAERYSVVCMDHISFISLPICGHGGCGHLLAMVAIAVNICVHASYV